MNRQSEHRDEGAVVILVAIMMVVLLGAGALVIDIGAGWVEKRQLQNGADAAALAVAQECSEEGDCGDEMAMAESYADGNANDGSANVTTVCGLGPGLTPCTGATPPRAETATGWVRVVNQTETEDGGDEIQFVLAPVINAVAGATVEADAIAAWGPMANGAVAPFVFSICEYTNLGGSFDGRTFPSGVAYIIYHGQNRDDPAAGECSPSPSGQDIPGGFGRVDSLACVAAITTGQWATEDPGNDLRRGCNVASWRGEEIVLALYDQVRGVGRNGEYHIVGFVGFRLLGDRLGGNNTTSSSAQCPALSPTSVRYMCGEFTKVSDNLGDFGTGNNYGASVVKMIG